MKNSDKLNDTEIVDKIEIKINIISGRENSGYDEELQKRLFELLDDEDETVALILPEKATYQVEGGKEWFAHGHNLLNLEITSFSKLARKSVPGRIIDALGQSLMVYDVLISEDNKDNNSNISGFPSLGQKTVTPGTVLDICSVLKEMSSNGITNHNLLQYAADFSHEDNKSSIAQKLEDLAEISTLLEERGYFDETNRLERYADLLFDVAENKETHYLTPDIPRNVFLMGFDYFNSAQYSVMEGLIRTGSTIYLALCYDKDSSIFNYTKSVLKHLEKIAVDCNVILVHRYMDDMDNQKHDEEGGTDNCSILQGLERLIASDSFVYSDNQDNDINHGVKSEVCNDLKLIETDSPEEEFRYVAESITELFNEGVHYSDMVVCIRDADTSEQYFSRIFKEYNIPYYFNSELSLSGHPLYNYVLCLLRVIDEDASFSSVFSLLKTGFYPVTAENCDKLENYCLAHGIRGNTFFRETPWKWQNKNSDNPDFVCKINELRREVFSNLIPFRDKLKAAADAKTYSEILWSFIRDTGALEKLKGYVGPENDDISIFRRTWLASGVNCLVNVFDQLVTVFGSREMSIDEYIMLFAMAAEKTVIRTVPMEAGALEILVPGNDHPRKAPYVFITGFSDSQYPSAPPEGGFFNLSEREEINNIIKNSLGEDNKTEYQTCRLLNDSDFFYEGEAYIIYRWLTMGSRRLTLSYNIKGDEARNYPAPLMEEITNYIPGVKLQHVTCGERVYINEKEPENTSSHTIKESILKIYPGNHLNLSVSALEKYRRCPFSYFADYGLGLKEREELSFKAPDIGTLLHDVLCSIMEYMSSNDCSWETLETKAGELIPVLVKDKLNAVAADLYPEDYLDFLALIISDNLTVIIKTMVFNAKQGDMFLPYQWEVPFGEGKTLQGLSLNVKGGSVSFRGVIDRIDKAEYQGKSYFRIVDYKTSGKDLNLYEMYNGIKTQLPLYALIASKHLEDSEVAGIFYQSLKDVYIKGNKNADDYDEAEISKAVADELRLVGYAVGDNDNLLLYCHDDTEAKKGKNGKSGKSKIKKPRIMSSKEFELLNDKIYKDIKQMSEAVLSGITDVRPYVKGRDLSCGFCPMMAVCGREAVIYSDDERLNKMSDAEVKECLYESH